QATEEAALDDAALPLVDLLELTQCGIERDQQIVVVARQVGRAMQMLTDLVEREFWLHATAFLRTTIARVVDQDVAHCLRCCREKVGAILKGCAALIHELEVRLVDE